ncbi:hypothetical protein GOBAR_AA14759 [Gossypium barbadense]|uniref:Hexosyltransferase n=1 Tax=Gossypium barbadense TaxID=3634 RepID=A0A2P5XRB8_GOSBA|nr:hypothetical protein GOBAR_AA14759 [Gossypium barbadense]
MKKYRRWLRIVILSLLSLSVLAPIVVVSFRLKTLTSIGKKDFIEDLASIKHRADNLRFNAIEQEGAEELKGPELIVFKEKNFSSVVSHISDKNHDLLETNGKEKHQIQQSTEGVNSTEKEQPNQDTGGSDQHLPSPPRGADEKVRKMRDQLVRAKAYLSFHPPNTNSHLMKELRNRIKEIEQVIGEASKDSELPRSANQKMRLMESALGKANRAYPSCSQMANKLRAMANNAQQQIRSQRNQESYLVQLAGRTTPKGLHCLSMQLTAEYFFLQPEDRQFPNQEKLIDPDLYHYSVFSDNILACAVVVNSTISSAKYISTLAEQKSSDPRYTSVLNHLRFYLPDIFPALNKIVHLDHDIIVQKDLTEIWSVDMKGKVNAAVETCTESEPSYRANAYVCELFRPVFGTEGLERPLWKAGSLPIGWITFYNQTVPLEKRWHMLGLGSNTDLSSDDIENATVLHYDGVMKPWLEIGITKYKGYWTQHLQYDNPYFQQCNIND